MPVVCDLLLLTWNRRDLLEPCVERIRTCTRIPYRLTIIDNGSTDTAAKTYLAGFNETSSPEVTVLRSPRNVSIAKAFNIGLAQTSAPWVCLLNNDILVTEGWLEEMLRVAQSRPEVGLVNPMSNEFGVTPRRRETINHVALRLRQQSGQWLEHWKTPGFCLLFSRQVLRRVGYWDERFTCYFEDMDFALRTRAAGFKCVVAEGAYVFHIGGATLKRDPRRAAVFQENQERFRVKWPEVRPNPLRIAYVCDARCAMADSPDRETIRDLANAGHAVWVFVPSHAAFEPLRHVQVKTVRCHHRLFAWSVLGYVLAKKKRFHRIMATDSLMQRWLDRWRPLHRAVVTNERGIS